MDTRMLGDMDHATVVAFAKEHTDRLKLPTPIQVRRGWRGWELVINSPQIEVESQNQTNSLTK